MIILGDGLNNMKNQDAQHIKNKFTCPNFQTFIFSKQITYTYNLEETFAKIHLPDLD